MEGIVPVSKSSISMFRKCPRHLYNRKVLKLGDTERRTASVGKQVHDWRAQIIQGQTGIEAALAQITDPEVSTLACEAIVNADIPFERDQVVEKEYHNPRFHGILDRAGRAQGKLFVEELKTGRWEFDDQDERDVYCVLLWDEMATDDDESIEFVRFFCRSGNHYRYRYTRDDIADARERILAIVAEIEAAEPVPNPGGHCLDWYGGPCAYHGTEHCPLAENLPSLIDAVPMELAEIGQAFMAIFRGAGSITPASASLALQGVHQIEAAAEIVTDALKAWAEANGPIMIGSDKFGWSSIADYEVDKAFALNAMLQAGMPIEDIAKAVSISKTNLKTKISKRKYGQLGQQLLDLAVIPNPDKPKRKFGLIKQ